MTDTQARVQYIGLVEEAMNAGARLCECCKIIGISERTVQRWKPLGSDEVVSDQRPMVPREKAYNALSAEEEAKIIEVCNREAYASLPPSQIVPKLADKGEYIASESTIYRVLRRHNQLSHRGKARKLHQHKAPTTYTASAPNQVWTWDVTWLPSEVKGNFYYLFMVKDLYSRYGVNWEVHEHESGEFAAELIEKAVWREKLGSQAKPVLHNDNGSIMKSFTFRAKLQELGISQSFSRPRVSDDNAYIESMFRTLKYTPSFPSKGFKSLAEAQIWVEQFMQWYNHEHQHSGINFVTPAQRHHGQESEILAKRTEVYKQAKENHPERWSKDTRNWSVAGPVTLNPDKISTENLKKAA
jgi:transposase InsO family protein